MDFALFSPGRPQNPIPNPSNGPKIVCKWVYDLYKKGGALIREGALIRDYMVEGL